jgi:hypothetical protein
MLLEGCELGFGKHLRLTHRRPALGLGHPGSARHHTTGAVVIWLPRSAWLSHGRGRILCVSQVSGISWWANVALAYRATSQPPTSRRSMSRMTEQSSSVHVTAPCSWMISHDHIW